jgi:glyoxylase-like metal-dependent hydrolase (beta-lactamase superfamily II)
MMKIYHLNCGSLVAPLVNINSLVYCLLVDTSQGLVLVDTGFGTRDYDNPTPKMRFFLRYMGVPKIFEETAYAQVIELGYKPQDVKHIIQTHLHIDHAGGLADFPWAEVHVHQDELHAIQNPRGLMEFAYIQTHWAHEPKWKTHTTRGDKWFGLDAAKVLETPELDFYLIPLPGHTRGHCGVALGKTDDWLFHCGDAASPYHSGGDLHNRGQSAYVLNILPEKVSNRILGGHVPQLRKLLREHEDQVKAISAHDMFSFREYNDL